MTSEVDPICSICGNSVDRSGPAIGNGSDGEPSWVAFVDEFSVVPGELTHAECFALRGGLAALLDAVHRTDVRRRERTLALARRPRCQLCGEPVELADPGDPESWVHAEDANDLADHTAEVDAPPDAR